MSFSGVVGETFAALAVSLATGRDKSGAELDLQQALVGLKAPVDPLERRLGVKGDLVGIHQPHERSASEMTWDNHIHLSRDKVFRVGDRCFDHANTAVACNCVYAKALPSSGSSCIGCFGGRVVGAVQEEQSYGSEAAGPGPIHGAVHVDLIQASRGGDNGLL